MPDEGSGVSNVYFGVNNEDGIRWQELSGAVSFDIEAKDNAPLYERYVLDDAELKAITLVLPWWLDPYSFACDIFGFVGCRKPKYTIRRLRRGGKSHRG